MTERGEPKNLVGDVENKRTADATVVVDVEDKKTADVEDKRADDIKAVKGPMKDTMLIMQSLLGHVEWCDEAALMFQIAAEQLMKIKNNITTLTVEEMMQLLQEED